MPVIDFHAHWTPVRYREAIAERGRWLTLGPDAGELHNSGFRMTLQERLADMDALGVDLQVLSPTDGFYQYENELETTVAVSRACNDEIAEIAAAWPARFLGLGTLPMQDTDAAVAELERAVRSLGLTGVMIGDHVNGATYDDARFTAFWQAAQDLGALVFFHQGLGYRYSFDRYFLQNAIGNHVERATTFAVLAEGGVLDRFGNLKLLFGHGGGYAAWAAARMEKAQGFFGEDTTDGAVTSGYRPAYKSVPDPSAEAKLPAGAYLRRFYFDCCTFSGPLLRFLIDNVGADRVVFGSDAPTPMVLTNGVRWVRSLDCLTEQEKRMILSDNAARLLAR
ncbi:MAG TPA: amidohydrolase family protein [Streptosporangiaceae bacterium]|nr:amidohydrolase family protein [Streptosporangiaceae bacterium]